MSGRSNQRLHHAAAFPVGRWEFAEDAGSIGISGGTEFSSVLDGITQRYYVTSSGSFAFSRVGGPEHNYIEIDCEGVTTGKGKDRFLGSSNGNMSHPPCPADFTSTSTELDINREYKITGRVHPDGSLVLTNTMIGGAYTASMKNHFKTGADNECFVADAPAD